MDGKVSETVPASSYRLGVKSAACHDIYPKPVYNALRHAIINHFEKSMPGFLTDEGERAANNIRYHNVVHDVTKFKCHKLALIHGVETRTSSPVRIARHPITLQAVGVDNMYPAGEGKPFGGFKVL